MKVSKLIALYVAVRKTLNNLNQSFMKATSESKETDRSVQKKNMQNKILIESCLVIKVYELTVQIFLPHHIS